MQAALRLTTRVLPGHRLEIVAPELADGEAVDVFVVLPRPAEAQTPAAKAPVSLMDFLDALPPGPRSAPTWEALESNLQKERDAWDR